MALILPKSKDVTLALRMLFLKTEKKLVAELKRQQAKDLVDYGTYASVMRVQKILQNMQDESFVYVPEMVTKVFRDTNSRYAYEAAEALTVPQTAIAEQLTYNLLGNIQEAAETALKTSETILEIGRLHPDVFRNPAIAASLESEALGGSWSTAVKSALRTYQNGGITSFVDKSGRNWSLTDYCTMATRTVTNQASVAAALTSDDWDLWQIIGGRATCSVCSAYQGRVYSKSGTNPDYPPLSAAFGKVDAAGGNDLANTYLNIHPNCLCSLVRYTTAGKTDKQIERDKEFSSFEKRPADVDYRSKKQLAAYREKERTRAEFLQTRRQWNDYRDRLGKEIPSLETFEKHKKAGDDKFKAWEKAYRKKGAELRKENPELFVKKPKAPPPAPAPKPFVSSFKPAESIAEAEKYAERFTDANVFGAVGVSFKGVDLEVANKVNKTIGDFFDEFDVEKFGGIIAPAGNTKLGKLISNATAGYVPIRKSFVLNRKSLKDVRTATEALTRERTIISEFLAHPENYDTDRMSRRVYNVLMNSRQSGRGTVPETIEEVISHELGHSLERPLRNVANYEALKARMAEYAPRISGYATEDFSEYVAESFASWRKGENLIDPEMVKAFESLKRKRP